MPRLRWLVLFLLISAVIALAQVPSGNVYFGYAYQRASVGPNDGFNVNGWDAQVEGKVIPFLGIVGDIGGTYGSDSSVHNFLFGPRVSARVAGFRPFGELLIGVTHINVGNGAATDTSFGTALGGGLDYKLVGPLNARGQLDWIHTTFFSHTQNDARLTLGVSFSF